MVCLPSWVVLWKSHHVFISVETDGLTISHPQIWNSKCPKIQGFFGYWLDTVGCSTAGLVWCVSQNAGTWKLPCKFTISNVYRVYGRQKWISYWGIHPQYSHHSYSNSPNGFWSQTFQVRDLWPVLQLLGFTVTMSVRRFSWFNNWIDSFGFWIHQVCD